MSSLDKKMSPSALLEGLRGFVSSPSRVIITTLFSAMTLAFFLRLGRRKKRSTSRANRFKRARKITLETLPPKDMEKLEERKPSILWNTAMFFPDYCASDPDSKTQQFLWYFAQAKTSIRVCIYNFSFPELESVIIQQFHLGLIVQFIVGVEGTAENLRRHRIPCGILPKQNELPDTDQLMHHKFAIIDDEAVIVGSMNWTVEGVVTNKENVCVSTNPNHVKGYLGEFLKLYKLCEDDNSFY